MKKALPFLMVLSALMACQKEQPAPPTPSAQDAVQVPHDFRKKGDYRDQYVGDYEYTIDYWRYSAGAYPDPIYRDTTWYYPGTVSIADNSENRLLVHWGDGVIYPYDPVFTMSNQMIVDSAGVLTYPEYGGTIHMTFGPASIKNDTIRFKFTDGGVGSSRSWTVMGVKAD